MCQLWQREETKLNICTPQSPVTAAAKCSKMDPGIHFPVWRGCTTQLQSLDNFQSLVNNKHKHNKTQTSDFWSLPNWHNIWIPHFINNQTVPSWMISWFSIFDDAVFFAKYESNNLLFAFAVIPLSFKYFFRWFFNNYLCSSHCFDISTDFFFFVKSLIKSSGLFFFGLK